MAYIAPTVPFRQFETVNYDEWSYTMDVADFDGGCFIREINGKPYGSGTNAIGIEVTLPLGVPLCVGCDGEIQQHLCEDCQLAFVSYDLPELAPENAGKWL